MEKNFNPTKASRANEIIDEMIARRLLSNPDEDWTRDITPEYQRMILGDDVTVSAESDNGRGVAIVDLLGRIPGILPGWTDDAVVSVKSTAGKNRKHGRTAVVTTGTHFHIKAVINHLMLRTTSIPLLFVHQNTSNGQWVQTVFDMAAVMRGVMARDGAGDYHGPVNVSTGAYGVPIVMRIRSQNKGKYHYPQLRFNMNGLVTPENTRIFRGGGKMGYGLVPAWRKVDAPYIEWEV